MGVQVDIFGSCVCRDIIHYTQKGEYEVNRCIGSIPITTLYETPLSAEKMGIENLRITTYDKRMLKMQLKRNAVELLKKSDAQILILDIAEEAMKRYRIGESKEESIAYQDENETVIKEAFSNGEDGNRIVFPESLDLDWADKKYKQFAKDIVWSKENPYGYQEKNIVVIESFYTEKRVGSQDGILHVHDAEYRVKAVNEWLKSLYGILYKYLPECQIIKMPIFTYTTENHLRGVHPLSYETEAYLYFANVLDVLCGKSKCNSIDNLYEEQCLRNKLYTRVLRSSSIYDIGTMKKEIKALQQEVTALKKEISRLKNE